MTDIGTHTQTLAQALLSLQTQGLERLDAQLLLLHVLGQPLAQRGWLLAHNTNLLPTAIESQLQLLAQRRLAGEPVAYLTGSKAFYGLDLQVNPDVLVPRPDTETLVDWALEQLAALLTPPTTAHDHSLHSACAAPSVLDLGTGSGAIALALKAKQPALQVWATDFSATALATAQINAQRLQLGVQFSQGAWFAALPARAMAFDCIVSNPPYIADADPHLAALSFEPQSALTSGVDGLDDLRQIIADAPHHLKAGGWLLLEHGYDQALAVRHLLQARGFAQVQSRCDLSGIERCSGGQWPAQRQ